MSKILIFISLLFISTNVFSQELTNENILKYFDEIEMKYKEIVLKQILHETNHLKYKSAIKNNNLLGLMRRKRLMKFSHWTECLDFYKSKFQSNIPDNINYYKHLRYKKYARDRRYISKLKKINTKSIINKYNGRDSTSRGTGSNQESSYICKAN